MAYDALKPADDQFISAGPGDVRENMRALKDDKIVNAQKVMDYSPGNASGNIPVSNGTVNTNMNADMLDGNHASAFATAGHTHAAATQSSNGLMSNTDKAKLDGIAAGAEVNQNAFATVVVGATTIQADAESDTLTLVAGENIAITPDAVNDNVTIAFSGPLPIANGGTGATTAAAALAALGVTATAAELNHLDGITATAAELNYTDGVTSNIQTQLNGKAPTSHASAATTYGVASATNYGHAKATEEAPIVAGTAAVGTDNGLYARGDHVHPAQTSVSGNAGTASKLAAARTISLTGDVTGSVSFDGSANAEIAATVANDSHTHTAATLTGVGGGRQLFTTSGTFTVPTGVTEVYVTGCGGGGGGGAGSNGWNGGGGGGAGYRRSRQKLAVTAGQAYTVTVGAGGGQAAAGGATSFGALLTLSGGGGGGNNGAGGGGYFQGGFGGTDETPATRGGGFDSNMQGTVNGSTRSGGGGAMGIIELYNGSIAGATGGGGTATGGKGYGAGGGGGRGDGMSGAGGAGEAGVLLVEW